jgi:DNA repair protein RecO (recombination protein O)
MAIHADRAIILRRTPFGESSLVVQVLCAKRGRVHLLAKGAYRTTSRFFAVLDLFDSLDLEWSSRRGADLGLLRSGSLARRRRGPTRDLERYRVALTCLELAELAARPGQPDGALFRLLEDLLDRLDAPQEATPEARGWSPDLALVVFELRFLQNLGLAPALERCAACGGPAPPVAQGRAAFSAGAGGRLCRPCADDARTADRRVGTLPEQVLATADLLSRAELRDPLPSTPISHDLSQRLRDFVGRFLDYHLETRPTSQRPFLSAPNRNAPPAGAPRS